MIGYKHSQTPSFTDTLATIEDTAIERVVNAVTANDVERTLSQSAWSIDDALTLLSPVARNYLEPLAQLSHAKTVQHFGRTMQLFTPMYIANYCDNGCIYCGYSHHSHIARERLTLDDIDKEAQIIAASGLEQVLVLTGESNTQSPPSYIQEAVAHLVHQFSSVSIEVYSMTAEDYTRLVHIGTDGMTMFQETYNPTLYKKLHPFGPKRDFHKRIDTPALACEAGFRVVNIGALMGLDEWRREAYKTMLHIHYLMNHYPHVDFSVSVPRIRPCAVGYQPEHPMDDISLVQYILALRLLFPRLGITLSSRESPSMRNHLTRLGITKMSAGVTTSVGGHTKADDSSQFTISDDRSVHDMVRMLESQGYQPIFKDWHLWQCHSVRSYHKGLPLHHAQ